MGLMDEKMCEIKFLPDGVSVCVAPGTPLTEVADAADVRIGRHCGAVRASAANAASGRARTTRCCRLAKRRKTF